MQRSSIAILTFATMALITGCNRAESPEKVADAVSEAQQDASKEIKDAREDAAASVGKASAAERDKSQEVTEANVSGSYEIGIAKADAARKVAKEQCTALQDSQQKSCKDRAEADYDAAKANLKALKVSRQP